MRLDYIENQMMQIFSGHFGECVLLEVECDGSCCVLNVSR